MGRNRATWPRRPALSPRAELVLIPEHKTPVEEVAAAIEEAYRRGKSHAIIVVAEGYKPQALDLAARLEAMDIGFSTRVTILGHIQRGGKTHRL